MPGISAYAYYMLNFVKLAIVLLEGRISYERKGKL